MRQCFLLILTVCTWANTAWSQKKDTLFEVVPLQETVISANRANEARSTVAQQVMVLDKTAIEQTNAQTTAELLSNSGQVFVQKSQQGGGSPALRGFEASRVLLVVDGVRLNNAIYRAGHLQNAITLDNAALDRVEVLFGPASTVYGSDALGGAVCFYTKNPVMAAPGDKFRGAGSAFFRYGSVNQEKTTHADISLAGARIGSFTSFTFSDFGDLRMGKNHGNNAEFGLRKTYAEHINGKDSLVQNADPYLQRFSGYSQYDLLEKLRWMPNDRNIHTLNIQYSNSSDIPRYDRLTDPKGEGLSNAEWYYGPQERSLVAYTYTQLGMGWFDRFNITASYQGIEESRHSRSFGSSSRKSRVENVSVAGLTADAQKQWGRNSLRVGIDGQYNDVASSAYATNINTNVTSALDTRYPNGGSTVFNVAVYGTHSWKAGKKLLVSEGLRGGFNSLHSKFSDKTFFPFPFDEVTQQNPVISGNLGLVWNPVANWRLALNASTGFRAPNVDDLSKVFESAAGSVVVPNPDLGPEKTLNIDLNITGKIADKLEWETVFWATSFIDAIVTKQFQFNGQDSILYDGTLSRVLANQNVGSARIFGVSTDFEADISNKLAVFGSLTFTKGEITSEAENKPLDHIPPMFGRLGVRYHQPALSIDLYTLFNAKKPISEYASSGEDNPQYAPADGMPAWWTLNLKAGVRVLPMLRLQAGVENMLDTQYRVFASGINAPGRNFFLSLRVSPSF